MATKKNEWDFYKIEEISLSISNFGREIDKGKIIDIQQRSTMLALLINKYNGSYVQTPEEFVKILQIILRGEDDSLRARLERVIWEIENPAEDWSYNPNLVTHLESVLP